jgi:hypothetical protein
METISIINLSLHFGRKLQITLHYPLAKKRLEPQQLPNLYYKILLSKETTAIDRLCSDRPLRLQSDSSLCEPVTSRQSVVLFRGI